ncbi:MAG: septum formation initiator family protein [Verrucomicrobia bacterium]|nr:septum formation initiator family protein [Verrucomicrobiota bacterium]MDE3098804.1 septum formation initiator family protein [Verrucomicrobiota bacterium]
MNVDLGIWSKLTKIVLVLVVVAVLLLIGLCYLPLIQTNERYQRDNLRLKTELQRETELSRLLQAQIQALQTDPKAVERLAREKLGYAKPGETVVYFETNATAARP